MLIIIIIETKYNPIDIHTPLCLWSRNGFKEVQRKKSNLIYLKLLFFLQCI